MNAYAPVTKHCLSACDETGNLEFMPIENSHSPAPRSFSPVLSTIRCKRGEHSIIAGKLVER
jgi:hypothetical protein